MPWIPAAKAKYGVAVYNYNNGDKMHLRFNVGDAVHILEEYEGNWYKGCRINDKSVWGVFPCRYIHVKDAVVEHRGSKNETVTSVEPPIVQEMTHVLREWGAICKDIYKKNANSKLFTKVRGMLQQLISIRRSIVSGTMPADELATIKRKVADLIDFGNRILGLDLIVRNKQREPVDVDSFSSVEIYSMYADSAVRIQRKIAEEDFHQDGKNGGQIEVLDPMATSHVHSLYLTVNNFVCNIGEEADVYMSLYDGKNHSFISENYLVRWESRGLPRNWELRSHMKCLYTDLGSKDMQREKIFFVCQIVRIGRMELKESRDSDKKRHTSNLRRAFGIAVMDITNIVKGIEESGEENEKFIPVTHVAGENENLHQLIMRTIMSRSEVNHKGQGLFVAMKMLHADLKTSLRDYQHLIDKSTAVARKMGFPEVIMPGDIRNDLYVTLIQGDFEKGAKTAHKNVEATVCVCGEDGTVIPLVVRLGVGEDPMSEHRSCVYYQSKQPKWAEIVKIQVPIEDLRKAHLRFTYRHRSTLQNKDTNERDYGLSFIKLMTDEGTTLKDGIHNLVVYKLETRKYDCGKYLNLPSTREELDTHIKNSKASSSHQRYAIPRVEGFTLSKDNFQITTMVCSTKLTQNVDLLGLLKWKVNNKNLKKNLEALMKIGGEEIVKFLQDTLDALFDILMAESGYDTLVFHALIYIISLIAEKKFFHFYAVLDTYISEHFSAATAFQKLLKELLQSFSNTQNPDQKDQLQKTIKAFQYIFKFIVRSRELFEQFNESSRDTFENDVRSVFKAINQLMVHSDNVLLIPQGLAMKHLPTVIEDITTVFEPKGLSSLLQEFITNVPENRLTKQKTQCMNDIVHSSLFKVQECRLILLKMMTRDLRDCMQRSCEITQKQEAMQKKDETEAYVKLLSDILALLRSNDVGSTKDDIKEVMNTLLRTLIQTIIRIRDSPLKAKFVACLISLLRQMEESHYHLYIASFPHTIDLLDFLMEIFTLFRELIDTPVYNPDWVTMICLQNSVFMRAIKFFGKTLNSKFLDESNFQYKVWESFFNLGVAFLTQESLEMERFTQNKRHSIIRKYGNLRCEMGFEIRSAWFNLGQHKNKFIPDMVGPILRMTLVPETELRKATIPIFFDIMQCELHSRGSFKKFESEMITKLDEYVERGHGDEEYTELFYKIMTEWCLKHQYLKQSGTEFVRLVRLLLRRLLDYRSIIREENRDNRMSCTNNLLNFYKEINRSEMYIRYLYKLHNLHRECDNYTEAAYCLLLHAKQLNWSDEPVSFIRGALAEAKTHRELKENLYYDTIKLFEQGKIWEEGIKLCKELEHQYEQETFQYTELAKLLKLQASLYENITTKLRPEPEFFFVGYYGKGFPAFQRNRTFIYRGKEYERLSEFTSRILMSRPAAQKMQTTSPPSEETTESDGMFVQVFKVNPIMEEPLYFKGKSINNKISGYYKCNEVQKFVYNKPFRKGPKDKDNEFASMWIERTTYVTSYKLPGILRWFEVKHVDRQEISPLNNAIESMEITNSSLRELVLTYVSEPESPINPLSMKLNGTVDAKVMGGFSNYEKAFFTETYKKLNPDDGPKIARLKDLIASQVPILEEGVRLHGELAPETLQPFHKNLENCFNDLKEKVEREYGKKPAFQSATRPVVKVLPLQRNLTVARPGSIMSINSYTGSEVSEETMSTISTAATPPPEIPAKKKSGVPTPTKENRKSKSDWLSNFGGSSNSLDHESKNGPKHELQPAVELREEITAQRPRRPKSQVGTTGPLTPRPQHHASEISLASSNSSLTSPRKNNAPPLPTKNTGDYGNLPDDKEVLQRHNASTPNNLSPGRLRNKPPPPLPIKRQESNSGTPVGKVPPPKKPTRHAT